MDNLIAAHTDDPILVVLVLVGLFHSLEFLLTQGINAVRRVAIALAVNEDNLTGWHWAGALALVVIALVLVAMNMGAKAGSAHAEFTFA